MRIPINLASKPFRRDRYAEDELGTPVRRLILCGFEEAPAGLPCESEVLRGRFGAAGAFNAGLLGYLEASAL